MKPILWAGLLASLASASDPASALRIEVAFSATVTEVRAPQFPGSAANFGPVFVGDGISGSYLYDSSRADLHPGLTEGFYDELSPPFGLSFHLGPFAFDPASRPPGGAVDSFLLRTVIYNDYASWPGTATHPIDAISVLSQTRDLIGNYVFANIYFTDPLGIALDSTVLPAMGPDLSAFPMAEFHLWHPTGHPAVIADVDAVSWAIVPEPSTSSLLVWGLALLHKRRRGSGKPRTSGSPARKLLQETEE